MGGLGGVFQDAVKNITAKLIGTDLACFTSWILQMGRKDIVSGSSGMVPWIVQMHSNAANSVKCSLPLPLGMSWDVFGPSRGLRGRPWNLSENLDKYPQISDF